MVFGVRAGEQVVGQSKFLEQVQEALVEALVDFQRGGVLRIGTHRDGGAVCIGTGDHQHLPAHQPLVARKYIGG